MSTVWDFIQEQILGMKWLNTLLDSALTVLGLYDGCNGILPAVADNA